MTGFDPPPQEVRAAVERALAEDVGPQGDLTSELLPPSSMTAAIVARETGRLAGRACADEVFRQVDPSIAVAWQAADGDEVSPGQTLAAVTGPRASVLTAERTALNFLSHLSGVATEVSKYAAAAQGAATAITAPTTGASPARIRDTRKTTPGLRALEKAAVRAGGGENHRFGLSDWVMFKDNHLTGTTIADAVAAARQQWPGRAVYVECDRIDQAVQALAAGADALLLDNMTPQQVRDCVQQAAQAAQTAPRQCLLEVSGGITLDTVADYAATGVDFISVGRITNSAPALDIALDADIALDVPGTPSAGQSR